MSGERVALVANAVGTAAEALSALLAGPVPSLAVVCDGVSVVADVAAREFEIRTIGDQR